VDTASILEHIRLHSRDRMPEADLRRLERRVSHGLAIAGTETRFVLADDERASDLVVRAGRQALANAGLVPTDLDFLLYTGVGRAAIEPAMASAVQASLGATNATAFDVVDACASWIRALHVAHCYFKAGAYRRGMIVNCEAGLYAHAQWAFTSPDELDDRFAGFTIGEAATATVVSDATADDDFYFVFRTFGEHFHRCVIPQPSFASFFPDHAAPHVAGRLYARSHELFPIVTDLIAAAWEADPYLKGGTYDIAFGHEASERLSADITAKLGVGAVYFPIHRRVGNTVSASIPLAMSLAQKEARLARGDRVLVIFGSAGISVGFARFTF
jgi:3-oxoacyl-[acyl-carrier-protein] synthase III